MEARQGWIQGCGEVAAGYILGVVVVVIEVEPPEQCISRCGCWSGNVIDERCQSREQVLILLRLISITGGVIYLASKRRLWSISGVFHATH